VVAESPASTDTRIMGPATLHETNARSRMTTDTTTNRKPYRTILLVVGALVVGLVGRGLVTEGSDSILVRWLPWLNRTSITLFYGDAGGDYLVPVSRAVSHDDSQPEFLVQALLDGPAPDAGLTSLIPDGTVADSVVLDEGTLRVDLSGTYQLGAFALTHESLFQSMRSWPDVEEVEITVDGVPLEIESTGHLIYFYDERRDMLIARPTALERPGDVLAEYLAGPGDAQLTGLPSDIESIGVELGSNDLLTLEFTFRDSLRNYAIDHPDSVRRVLEGLIATFTTGFPEIGGVLLDFEGHNALGLGQCANLLNTAQYQPEVLNDERILSRYAGAS